MCETCAGVHCLDDSAKDDALMHKDAEFIQEMLDEGGENKIRSISMRAIFERLVENPAGVKKILDSADADDDAQRAAKRARNDKAAPSDAVVVE